MKILKNKQNQEKYFLLPTIKIQSYKYIWNPDKDKNITKEHLSLFLEKAFQKNFLSYEGSAWQNFYLDERCYTPLTDQLVIYDATMISYLADKDNLIEKEDKWPCIIFQLDSSDVYKPFSHLLSAENFSLLLRSVLFKLAIFSSWADESKLTDFSFISDKESLEKIEKENLLWIPEDEKLWVYYLKLDEERLIRSKMDSFSAPKAPSIEVKVEGIEKYLYEKNK